jgi:actin-related protein
MIKTLALSAEQERIKKEQSLLKNDLPHKIARFFEDSDDSEDDEEKEERKKKRCKYQSPEYLFIFDDISDELRKNKSIVSFIKKHRHFKSKCIFSSQYSKDLDPQSLKNMDFLILFRGESEDKLKHLYQNADLSISFEEFQKIYNIAVNHKPYSFLYIDKTNNTFRINFNQEIKLKS